MLYLDTNNFMYNANSCIKEEKEERGTNSLNGTVLEALNKSILSLTQSHALFEEN